MLLFSPNKTRSFGTLALMLIGISAAFNLRNLPMLAQYGIESMLIYLVAALCFFIPCGLACAELSSGWPDAGGMYVWIREAFGHTWGFLAVWLDWIINLIWFPLALSFMVGTLAYLIQPDLANNKLFMCVTMLGILWLVTLLNFFGINFSGRFSGLTALIGALIPCIILISVGLHFFITNKAQAIHNLAYPLNTHSISHYSYITNLILSFAGIEAAGLVAYSKQDLKHNYPRAIFLSIFIIIAASLLGTLALNSILSPSEVNLVSGIMQAFKKYSDIMHIQWLTPIIIFLTVIGCLSALNTWIAGPARSLMIVASSNRLPIFLKYRNKKNSPIVLLLIQAILSTLLISIFLWMPTISDSYWLLSVLTAQLTLIMYLLLFASVIRLRKTQPHTPRLYSLSTGKKGAYLIFGIGIITCLIAIVIGFIPPEQLNLTSVKTYEYFLFGGLLLALSPVFLFKKKEQLKTLQNSAVTLK